MIILGLAFIFISVVFVSYMYASPKKKLFAVLAINFVLFGTAEVLIDISSPVIVKETLVQTNDYAQYGLPIQSNRVGIILKKEYTNVIPFTLTERVDEYLFLDWVEE